MIRKSFRFLSFFLAILMLPAALCGCSATEPEVWTQECTLGYGPEGMSDFANLIPSREKYLTEHADLIVYGKIISQEKTTVNHMEYLDGTEYTEYYRKTTVRVKKCLKGNAKFRVTFVDMGGIADGVRYSYHREPVCEVGKEYLLFLKEAPDGTWIAAAHDGELMLQEDGMLECDGVRWEKKELLERVALLYLMQKDPPQNSRSRTRCVISSWASRSYTLTEALDVCSLIVYGTVVSKGETETIEYHPVYDTPFVHDDYQSTLDCYRRTVVQVESCLLGDAGETVEYLEPGGIVDGEELQYLGNTPAEIGDRVLLFLLPNGLPYFPANVFHPFQSTGDGIIWFREHMLPEHLVDENGYTLLTLTLDEYMDVVKETIAMRQK